MKRVLSLLLPLFFVQLSAMELEVYKPLSNTNDYIKLDLKDKMRIDRSALFVPERLGAMEVFHSLQGFYIKQNNQKHRVKKYFTDPMIRNINKKQLKAFLESGYLTINQMEDGEYKLLAKIRVKGSGPIGAAIGACIGKVAVSVAGHGAIVLVGALTGPAAPATIIALEALFGPAIEGASMAGAVAGGIALGVATGPV